MPAKPALCLCPSNAGRPFVGSVKYGDFLRESKLKRWLSNDILDFKFDAADERCGQVVDGGGDDEADEAEDSHEYGAKKVNDPDDSELRTSENNHGYADESVDEAEEGVEQGHDFARLEDADSDDLFFHRGFEWMLVE